MIKKIDFEKYMKATNNQKSFLISECDKSGLKRSVFVEIAENFEKYKALYEDNKFE